MIETTFALGGHLALVGVALYLVCSKPSVGAALIFMGAFLFLQHAIINSLDLDWPRGIDWSAGDHYSQLPFWWKLTTHSAQAGFYILSMGLMLFFRELTGSLDR